MQRQRRPQFAARYLDRLYWFNMAFGLSRSTVLLFSLLVWGELAQVEFVHFKVVKWLVEVWGNCPGGNKSAEGKKCVCVFVCAHAHVRVCVEEYDTWTTPSLGLCGS